MVKNVIDNLLLSTLKSGMKLPFSARLKLIVDYVTGAESMQFTKTEFEEWGQAKWLKLPELIGLLSKPVVYTILISNKI